MAAPQDCGGAKQVVAADTPATDPGERESRALRFWHATPLHYLPCILQAGALLSKERLAASVPAIRPRRSAVRRDRKLGLAPYVHLSLCARTPLLADKIARGYAHALLEFDAAVADLPGSGYIRYNTKAWRHRDDFAPIVDPAEKLLFVDNWRRGRYPSAELLVLQELPLVPHALAVHVVSEAQLQWIRSFGDVLCLDGSIPLVVSPDTFPPGLPPDMAPLDTYRDSCAAFRTVLPPPDLPFD